MSINHWPKAERPREKLLEKGAQYLSDAELLAIFLRTGIKGKTAVDLGRELLNNFGSLRKIIEASANAFCQTVGLGLAKYVQLQASFEIAARCMSESLKYHDILHNPNDAYQYLMARLQHYPHEVFACLFLDNANRLIVFEELFHGTIDSATVHPRTVITHALKHNAAAVILAHNHPSGNTEPSLADKQLTQRLKEALDLIDVHVLDHIIIGDGAITSFAQRGLLL